MAVTGVQTRVYLARHCDVLNPRGLLYGHLPGFPLSDLGVEQAHAMGRFLAGKPLRAIYTSPLERATQTAGIIAGYAGDVPVEVDEDLTESRFGLYLQGVPAREVPWRRPLWFIHRMRRGLLPGDESVATMAARIRRPLLRLVRDFPGEGGVCVSHGDPIQALWTASEGGDSFRQLNCAKGGILELTFEGETLTTSTYHSPKSLGERTAAAEPGGTGTPEAESAG